MDHEWFFDVNRHVTLDYGTLDWFSLSVVSIAPGGDATRGGGLAVRRRTLGDVSGGVFIISQRSPWLRLRVRCFALEKFTNPPFSCS